MYLAQRNFKCNGVKKKKGDKISEVEAKKMDKFIDKLLHDDIIARESSSKPEIKKLDKSLEKKEPKEVSKDK